MTVVNTDASTILDAVSNNLEDVYWIKKIKACKEKDSGGIHLGIFIEPYLQYILEGKKTVESRFSINHCPPHGRVFPGDILLLKKSSGPILGLCEVTDVSYYELNEKKLSDIREKFSLALCAKEQEFWTQRKNKKHVTLMEIRKPVRITPMNINKKGMQGWVILRQKKVKK